MPSQESRRRQALNYSGLPSRGAGGAGLLGPGVCGLGGADTLNIECSLTSNAPCDRTALVLYCPSSAPHTSSVGEGDSIPTLPDGSSALACRVVPQRLSYSDVGTRFIAADNIRNLGQEDRAVVMPHRNNRRRTSLNGYYANHNGGVAYSEPGFIKRLGHHLEPTLPLARGME